ncbi:helix-turn-helix domain-containing protein [Micromonospora avicenniae]|uniref:Helix-turn-helix domain-containing protein n=1 Tax=Micromonospora avicenniae TaxID=1198245 RepID=A0A1N7EMY2_9ACTN|nr:helix-turn-helix transcriptional regulator [Micromonospora avicenniae]SIR89275.1 Helix-turn-helix domain-containing protein [Micromonospora avicenniae]
MEERINAIGEFLRARRERLRPEDVGLPATGYRRTPGLRREEVAMLAGISTDYYLRLEQGRDRTPSAQVLDALARVLQLDVAETTYLYALTQPRPKRAPQVRVEKVPAGTLRLLDALPMPAFVEDRYLTVLAANQLAQALSPNMRTGVNRLAAAFLDPRDRELHDDWEQATAAAVGQLRAVMGTETTDPRMLALVGELSNKSERFRRLWVRQDVVRRTSSQARLHHPEVGDLELYREKLIVAGTDNQVLVIYHAEPGTPSEQALALLGSIAVSAERTANPAQQTNQPNRGEPSTPP